jgi:hypothetical protein
MIQVKTLRRHASQGELALLEKARVLAFLISTLSFIEPDKDTIVSKTWASYNHVNSKRFLEFPAIVQQFRRIGMACKEVKCLVSDWFDIGGDLITRSPYTYAMIQVKAVYCLVQLARDSATGASVVSTAEATKGVKMAVKASIVKECGWLVGWVGGKAEGRCLSWKDVEVDGKEEKASAQPF